MVGRARPRQWVILAGLSGLGCLGWPLGALAQSIAPATDNTGTVVTPEGNTYVITGGTAAGDNLFHNFATFGLTTGEAATFVTAPTVQNVVGQITGGSASVIDGLLQVSGSAANLYLLNPVGILFGPNAALNLSGSFYATTASGLGFGNALWSVGSDDYSALVGNPSSFVFSGAGGTIVNAGNLSVAPGQSVLLLGGQVINTGAIAAPGGEITVAAVPGENLVRISQTGGLLSLELATAPSGTPTAAFTPVDLPALLTGPVSAAEAGIGLNGDGTVQLAGSSLSLPTGPGTALIAGQVNAAAATGTGGSVNLLGQQVGLVGADVQASGDQGGGSIRVGGDYLGQGTIPNARAIFVDEASSLQANAATSGNGGRIILWSDEVSRIYGDIRARGGAISGDGGFVETSSHQFLDVGQAPDVGAPAGAGGTWLIDPETIRIISRTTTAIPQGNFVLAGNVFSPAPAGSAAVISDLTISNALLTGNVTVATNDGDIFFSDPFATALLFEANGLGNTLTFQASNDVAVQTPITVGFNPINFVLTADSNNDGVGSAQINRSILTNGGSIEISGSNATNNGVTINAALNTAGGDILVSGVATGPAPTSKGVEISSSGILRSGGGDITITGFSTNDTGVLIDGNVFSGGGALTVNGKTDSAAAVGINVNGGQVDASGGNFIFTGSNGAGATAINVARELRSTGFTSFTATQGDVQLTALEIVGGDASITADRYVRLTGFLSDFPGVSVQGSNGATVTITHGGNGVVPFVVGDAATNGSAGLIADGITQFGPSETIFGDDIRGNLAILTDIPPVIPDPVDDPTINLDCLAQCPSGDDVDIPDGETDSANDGTFSVEVPESIETALEAWQGLDGQFTQEFVNYLGLPDVPEITPEQAQEELLAVAQATGVKPALIYVTFVSTAPLSAQKPDEQTAAVASQLKVETPLEPGPLLAANPAPASDQDQLELILVTPGQNPLRLRLPEATRGRVEAMAERLRREVTDQTRLKTTTYLDPAQALYQWLLAPLEPDLQAQEIGHLSFIMETGLRSLPLAVLHDGKGFIIERYSVGLMPSLSLTDTRYVNIQSAQVLAMGASEFTDQTELPAVPVELETVTQFYKTGEAVLNQGFTPQALVGIRQTTPYPILHLATHGEFKPGNLQESYIQFWDQRLQMDQIDRLSLNNPPLELLVLSACRMALGDEQAELGFAGLAVKAGTKSAIASLWRVSDVGTTGLMTEFYNQLPQAPIKAEALRQAQLAMIHNEIGVKGESLAWSTGEVALPSTLAKAAPTSLSHPYYWAAFTLVGSPW